MVSDAPTPAPIVFSLAIFGGSISNDIVIRKTFPESWMWESFSNERLVNWQCKMDEVAFVVWN